MKTKYRREHSTSFPRPIEPRGAPKLVELNDPELTVRERIALRFMVAMLSNKNLDGESPIDLAHTALELADVFIRECRSRGIDPE